MVYMNMRLSGVSKVCIVTHRLADVDAYCSAYSLASLLTYYRKEVSVVFPEGLNTLAEHVRCHYDVSSLAKVFYDSQGIYTDTDMIVILDTNNASMLSIVYDSIAASKCKKVIMDHHPLSNEVVADEYIVDTDSSSTCELVYRLFKDKRIKMKREVAEALLLGILTDTQHLTIAKCSTIRVVDRLCRLASIEHARSILALERGYAEKVARLKSAQRCRLYRLDGFILALSSVGSYNASAAKALIDLGADVAMVITSEGNRVKASMRSTQSFYTKTRVHIGTDILAEISSSGGGHPTAGSIELECREDELMNKVIGILQGKIGRIEPI